ncbi:hypothetical protein B0J14DRAFT_170414 [Halenospora varia]|nr:hypothetical protein B0J14DRAFT_170414 [Halenospora varia]
MTPSSQINPSSHSVSLSLPNLKACEHFSAFVQHPTFIMTALSAARIFHTFHSNTTAVPAEITTQILNYIVADAPPPPLGGGVTTRSAHHPIASVSQTFRSIYLDHPYSTSTKGRATAPIKLRIGEALEFSDLRTLAAFFEDDPDREFEMHVAGAVDSNLHSR